MSRPEITVERDAAMRGWEVNIFPQEESDGEIASVVFIGDDGSLQFTAVDEDGFALTREGASLELGRTYGLQRKAMR